MGYIFLEQKLWVPLEFLEQSIRKDWRQQLNCIKSLTPLRRDHHNAYPFQVEWDLGGSVDWGPDWRKQSVELPTPHRLNCQFSLANRGLIECCFLSGEASKLRIKLSYEPLADEAMWQAFIQVFSSPRQQIQDDLEELKDVLETAYIDSLLEALPPLPPKNNLKSLVVPAA